MDVSYQELYFSKTELLIYKNNESEDYEFAIRGDIGGYYLSSFYRQVRDVVYPGMENFFERDRNFVQKNYSTNIVSLDEKQYTQKLIKDLSGNEIISDEILDRYIQSRALIDNTEINTLFLHNTEINYEGLIISCERLRNMLSWEILSALKQVSGKKYGYFMIRTNMILKIFSNKVLVIRKGMMKLVWLSKPILAINSYVFIRMS